MILLPVFEELRSFTIQLTSALKKTQTWTCLDKWSPDTDISFFKAKNSQLDTFFRFSLTKILHAASEMHKDNV